MKKVMILMMFPFIAWSQKTKPKYDSAVIKGDTAHYYKGPKVVADSVVSVSLNDYANDINEFIKLLGKVETDIYEKLTPKETMRQYWNFILNRRKKQ